MRRIPPLIAVLLIGCGPSDETEPVDPPGPVACQVGDVTLPDGSCQPPGVPADACGEGFVSDGVDGCVAVLPAAPCAEGQMAVPGEETCRPVAPCAPGTWGDIPVDAATQYVDAGYVGGGNNGSSAQPWTTIGEAVAAAAPGSVVAIAAGNYSETITMNKPLRIWGVCPELVQVGPAAASDAIVTLSAGADGAELHTLGLHDASQGVVVLTAANVVLDRLWIRDTTSEGIQVRSPGAGSGYVTGTLVERARRYGIYVIGGAMTLEHSVVRDGMLGAGGAAAGLWVQHNPPTVERSLVVVKGSVIERNTDLGAFLAGSDVTVESSVIRDGLPNATGLSGRGIEIIDDPQTAQGSVVTIATSVLERNMQESVFMVGSDVTFDATVVRDTYPTASLLYGRPVSMEPNPGGASASNLSMTRCLVERGQDIGIYVSHGTAQVAQTRVRDIVPSGDGLLGYGISVQDSPPGQATMTIQDSTVERTHGVGILVTAHATLHNVWVHDVAGQLATGYFGDGVVAAPLDFATTVDTQVVLTGSRVEAVTRAGIANFDGAVTLSDTELVCNPIDIAGEAYTEAYSFLDGGGNRCFCGEEEVACKAVSEGLEPPQPVQ